MSILDRVNALSEDERVRLAKLLAGEPDQALRTDRTITASPPDAGLAADAAIEATALTASADGLVAYLVCEDDSVVENARELVASELPEFMQPAAFVRLEKFPRLPNGKVDPRALPDPGARQAEAGQDIVAPEGDAEEALARIWADVLGFEPIGATDNFFELGGHSLLVNQVVARVHQTFDVDLPLRTVFDAPTVAEMAIVLEDALIADLEGRGDS